MYTVDAIPPPSDVIILYNYALSASRIITPTGVIRQLVMSYQYNFFILFILYNYISDLINHTSINKHHLFYILILS